MNIYLVIVLIGLMLKLWATRYALNRERLDHKSELNNVILLSATAIVTFSIPQFFLLSDGALATPFGLPRFLVLRWYMFHALVGTTIGIYLILAVFYPSLLIRKPIRLLLQALSLIVIIAGAVFILFSDTIIDASLIGKQALNIELGNDEGDGFLIFARVMMAVLFASLFINFLVRYKNASDHQSQILNLYAVIALFFSVLECIAQIFVIHPLLFSVKGVFFTIVVFLACSDRKMFDARSTALLTLEAKTSRDMRSIFRGYANNELTHKEATQGLEKALVSYKLQKVSGFRDLKGSPLPDVAENMDINLSTLYELIKRFGIRRPKT